MAGFSMKSTLKWKRSGPALKLNPHIKGIRGKGAAAFFTLSVGIEHLDTGAMRAAEPIIRQAIEDTFVSAKALAPRSKVHDVKDGDRLVDDITRQTISTKNKVSGRVRSGKFYGPFMEYGFIHWRSGRRIVGKPFMRPAAFMHFPQAIDKMRRLFG